MAFSDSTCIEEMKNDIIGETDHFGEGKYLKTSVFI